MSTNIKDLFRTVDSRYGRTTFLANDTGAVSLSLQTYGEWAQNEITFMMSLISGGETIVDVGAYIGTHTLAFADLAGPDGKVISIEPQTESFSVLEMNVSANQLTNVQLEHAAAADYVGTMYGYPIDITEKNSYGSASLPRARVPRMGISEQDQKQLVSIRVLTIDSLNLSSCALIKIDVEGFEDLVIVGAEQTIRRFSPVIYAECNSLANGLRTLEVMRQFGYEVYLHVVNAFNPENYFGVSKNIFGRAREASLIGVSGPGIKDVRNMTPRECELILKIENADDLALGLLNKPQYIGEILEIGAAARTGGDAWIREERWLRQAESDRVEHEIGALRAQVDAAMLQARFAREEADRTEAKLAELMRQHEELRNSLNQAQANYLLSSSDLARLEKELKSVHDSFFWRITKPFRNAKRD